METSNIPVCRLVHEQRTTTDLAHWLQSHACYDVRPVRVTIYDQTFIGCFYRQDGTPPPGARSQQPYTVEAIYLLGKLPACCKNSRRVAFSRRDDAREWYLASYWQNEPVPQGWDWLTPDRLQEYHPFGIHFQLFPCGTRRRIDEFERRPYQRVPMAVDTLA